MTSKERFEALKLWFNDRDLSVYKSVRVGHPPYMLIRDVKHCVEYIIRGLSGYVNLPKYSESDIELLEYLKKQIEDGKL